MGESRRVRRHCRAGVGQSVSGGCVGAAGQQSYLVRNVGPRIANVTVHLAHDANVFVAVQQRVLFLLAARRGTGPARSGDTAAAGYLERLEAGVGEDDNQPLGALVCRGEGRVLHWYQGREGWRG